MSDGATIPLFVQDILRSVTQSIRLAEGPTNIAVDLLLRDIRPYGKAERGSEHNI